MEMLRSLRRDKHELCLTVIKFKHVRSLSLNMLFYSLYHYAIFDHVIQFTMLILGLIPFIMLPCHSISCPYSIRHATMSY